MLSKYMLFALALIALLSGCSYKQPDPIVKTVVVTKIKTVKVPVPCKVPKVDCDFAGPGFTPFKKLLECVVKQKKALESIDNNRTK